MSVGSRLDLNALHANRNIAARDYWRSRLPAFEPAEYLYGDGGAHTCVHHREVYTLQAPGPVQEMVYRIAGSDKAKHIFLLAAFVILLDKYSGAEEIVVFTPVYRESLSAYEINNVIPVRAHGFRALTFPQWIGKLKDELTNDLKHGDYPLDRITGASPEQLSRLPLTGLLVEEIQPPTALDQLDAELLFSFSVKETLTLRIGYDPCRFSAEYIASIGDRYFSLLSRLIDHKETRTGDLQLLSAAERGMVVEGFNETAAFYPEEETIVSIFERQAARTPEHVAFWYGETSMTYGSLRVEAARIADWLRTEAGIGVGDLAGMMLEREEQLLPVIFGILKAGAAYVPIDPHYPASRIDSILEDAGLKVLITRGRYLQGRSYEGVIIADLDVMAGGSTGQAAPGHAAGREGSSRAVGREATGRDLAYVLYTSGSTGKPKGVMIEHRSVINRLLWMQKRYPIGEQDVLLQKTPVVFDVSVWELFWWSFTGASVCLLKPGAEKDPRQIRAVIERHKVSTIHFVPSMLKTFLNIAGQDAAGGGKPGLVAGGGMSGLRQDATGGGMPGLSTGGSMSSLRQVFASGEALPAGLVNQFAASPLAAAGARLINLYGPTEATVDVSWYECPLDGGCRQVPIGRPIDNTQLYILDDSRQPLPVGIAGGLYISGAGLARGYLNNAGLTGQRFVANPFREGSRMYRTGDRAKWLGDGNIVFLGRVDQQVKIRGFRIEPEEIAGWLERYEGITQAVVVDRDKEEDKYLVAYYVADREIDTVALRLYLSGRLPDYMIPERYMALDKMPLTVNGKLDRKALPEPVITVGTKQDDGPVTELEHRLAEIWSAVLGLPKETIGITRTFFELGGNSLKMVEVNALLSGQLQLHLSMVQLLRYPTISSLADLITDGEDNPKEYHKTAEEEVVGMQSFLSALHTK